MSATKRQLSEFGGGGAMVVGEMYGLRGWYIDHHGRLTGLAHRQVWRPGENIAECMAKRFASHEPPKFYYKPTPTPRIYTSMGLILDDFVLGSPSPSPWGEASPQQTGKAKKRKKAKKQAVVAETTAALTKYTCNPMEPWSYPGFTWSLDKAPKVHTDAPKDDCSCGFYAYHTATGEVYGQVIGVIKAYGQTVVGTKGLRCEKAQIAALLDPSVYTTDDGDGWLVRDSEYTKSRLARNYPDVPILPSVDALLSFAPLGEGLERLEPSQEEFWTQP